MKKHVLTETNYCATMFEHAPEEGGRVRCTAAGRYMDTEGRVICGRCATGRVVVKLTDIGALLGVVDHIARSRQSLTDEMRGQLGDLVVRSTKALP